MFCARLKAKSWGLYYIRVYAIFMYRIYSHIHIYIFTYMYILYVSIICIYLSIICIYLSIYLSMFVYIILILLSFCVSMCLPVEIRIDVGCFLSHFYFHSSGSSAVGLVGLPGSSASGDCAGQTCCSCFHLREMEKNSRWGSQIYLLHSEMDLDCFKF